MKTALVAACILWSASFAQASDCDDIRIFFLQKQAAHVAMNELYTKLLGQRALTDRGAIIAARELQQAQRYAARLEMKTFEICGQK